MMLGATHGDRRFRRLVGAPWLWRLSGSACLTLALATVVCCSANAQWFDEDAAESLEDEDNPYAVGLVARFRGADGNEHARLVDGLSFVWNDAPPDHRVQRGPYRVTFSGRLWTQSPGEYKLRVYAAGAVRLSINGEQLLDAHAAQPAWMVAEPIELPFGFQRLEVEFRRADEPGRIALFWEGPQFGFEPVASRWLMHDRDQAPSADFVRGELLVRGLKCAACHDLPGEPVPQAAPALNSLAGNISREWLIDWLRGPREKPQPLRRMPHFAFDRSQATSVADALLKASEPNETLPDDPSTSQSSRKKLKKGEQPPPPPSVELGAALFRSIGCLACHRVEELGTAGLFGGGDLSQIARKRPASYFDQWLADPARLNRDHRMPVFPLSQDQRTSLSLYLQSLGAAAIDESVAAAVDTGGAKLIQQAGCVNCHELPKSLGPTPVKKTPLSNEALIRTSDSCLGEPAANGWRPGFRLSEDYARAIQTFLTTVTPMQPTAAERGGQELLVEHNCLACHDRGWNQGISEHLPAIAEADPALAEVLPALQPPALHGIGDKLTDEALSAALSAPEPPRRPWLQVQMPKFGLNQAESAAIVRYLIESDRIPPRLDATLLADDAALSTTSLDAAGPRLVTADGFGCTSCHAIGQWEPQKVALNAQGTALSNIGQRVRREWFDRWVRNPARIVPKMEMPSVQQPVRGVLDGKLDAQLAAVWRVLNRDDFTPPNPSALRVVRRANLPDMPEPAAVLTDVIEVGGQGFIKPLVIGLDNRQSVLLDLATARLAAWWIGDVGRQQTRGKTWFWEAGMPQLLPVDGDEDAPSDLALVSGEQVLHALRNGQFVTEFDAIEHLSRGLQVDYRLHYSADEEPLQVRVRELLEPLAAVDGRAGFRRTLVLTGAPTESPWQLKVLPNRAQVSDDGRSAVFDGMRGGVSVNLGPNTGPQSLVSTPEGIVLRFETSAERSTEVTLEYRSEAQADQFPPLPVVDRTLERQELDVVPGYEAIRLPTTDEAMPTGLAWKKDGTLVITSLEGRVWLGRDTDGDELIDCLKPFADDLAAPYGVQVVDTDHGTVVDVINKYALLRLYDEDGDDRAERTETIASGWGHTRDYHDWAVGLERDDQQHYYIALPCEQDGRSEAAAYLRGRALRLIPREPTHKDPRRFDLEEICAGLRFPQGLALSARGRLFATDNQGNYNPFNELNYLEQGKRYGFINSLEARQGISPPAQPAAIEIPHPWTRSVNGIGYGPAPYMHDLIGCEYDTRRLVRMTLERAGDEAWQGAVYPFSREPIGTEPTFEGPLACRRSPSADFYVGNVRDSGWGAGSNTGSIVRLRYRGQMPPGIERVRGRKHGFTISFTTPVDPVQAANPASYSIVSYRRISTPAYGGDDVDRRAEKIAGIDVQADSRAVTLTFDELREGVVYEFHVRNIAGGDTFFPAEAYYTLRHRMPY